MVNYKIEWPSGSYTYVDSDRLRAHLAAELFVFHASPYELVTFSPHNIWDDEWFYNRPTTLELGALYQEAVFMEG